MLPSMYLAATLLLAFDFPRHTSPPPEVFVITAVREGGHTDTLHVAPSAVGSCYDDHPDTYCAQWPGCPEEGILTLTVQAVRGGVESAIETQVVCRFSALVPCVCLPVEGQAVTGTSAADGESAVLLAAAAREGAAAATTVPVPVVPSATGSGAAASGRQPVVVPLPTFPALAPLTAT